jgi:DNA mismatch repair protein MutS
MHNLPGVSCVADALCDPQSLRICHLTTQKLADDLFYDRILKPGPGESIYGLEVAKSVGLNRAFLDECHKIRNELLGISEMLVNAKTSRYSSAIYMDECMSCHKNKAAETHHIQPQRDADANGIINDMHKNHVSNLIPLCKQCHLDMENGKRTVIVRQITGGYELAVKET